VFSSNRSTDLQAHRSPHIGVLDTAFENGPASANSHTSGSQSASENRNLGEGPLTNKPNTAEVKIKKFPKFKFSLTAPPPKPKPKQPGQDRRVVSIPLLEGIHSPQRHTSGLFSHLWAFIARQWPRWRRKHQANEIHHCSFIRGFKRSRENISSGFGRKL